MQSSKETNPKSKRANKRRNSRKKSLSPTSFKTIQQEAKTDNKNVECKRSLSEGSVKVKHRKSNIRRTLSHPFTERIPDLFKKAEKDECDDSQNIVECVNSEVIRSVSEDRDARSDPGAPDPSILVDVAHLPSVRQDPQTKVKHVEESDDSNLQIEVTSSDRDTEDERRSFYGVDKVFRKGVESVVKVDKVRSGVEWSFADPLLRFGRQQFAADSGSDLESLAASTVRRVSVRRRRGTPETGSSSAKEEFPELESGRMKPEDYRLVFLSSDSSCKEDNEDSSSTASSAAPLYTDDCDWDYFEPGGAGAGVRPLPATPTAPPPPPPICDRACSCGAEPRIVAVPVPVPVPVPAALWPSLLVYPDTTGAGSQHWPFLNFHHNFPAFRNFDAVELGRFASKLATAPTSKVKDGIISTPVEEETLQNSSKTISEITMATGDLRDLTTATKSDVIQHDEDVSDFVAYATEKITTSEPMFKPDSNEIKVITEEILRPVEIESNSEEVFGHLNAEKAFSSSDSSESTDSEQDESIAERSYEVCACEPDEPATSDADSDDSSVAGVDGRFARVFVVNPADSSSDVEDNADSSGIDCSEGEDKSVSARYDDITIEEALLNDKNSLLAESTVPESGTPEKTIPTNGMKSADNLIIPYDGNVHDAVARDDKSSVKCYDFIKFCDINMLQSDPECLIINNTIKCVDITDITREIDNTAKCNSFRLISEDNSQLCLSEEKQNFEHISRETDADISVQNQNVKSNEGLSDRSIDSPSNDCENETQESKINLSTGVTASPVSRPASPIDKIKQTEQIDLLRGIERTLSELLKNEASFARRQDEEKLCNNTAGPVIARSAGEPSGAPAVSRSVAPAAATVCRSRSGRADGHARYTSRVMITHDHVSVVTSDTTRLMRDVTVHHTNSEPDSTHARENARHDSTSEDEGSTEGEPKPASGVTVVTNADTLSAVVCLEEGLADDDSWVEDVSHDEDAATSPTESDSGDEATLSPGRSEEFTGYCRRSLDFTLHTIVEESCEESEPEQMAKRSRPISATELEKYFFFGLGDGRHVAREEEEPVSETSSVCSEGIESVTGPEGSESRDDNSRDPEELASSRLEKYFLSGFMGFKQERRDSDGSGSVGSDSEGRHSPEHRRKRLVRARGTPRSHSSSLDNLLAGDEPQPEVPDDSEGSSTETENCHDSTERLDLQGDSKRRKQGKKTRNSPAEDRRHSAEFAEDAREDTRSISEGEEGGRSTPRQEFPLLGSDLSESKKQTSRDSGFVGSCDDLLRSGDSSTEFGGRGYEQKTELEEITEEIRPDAEERIEVTTSSQTPLNPLSRKDSFNNWSSDEETNLMMTKMRQFFKTMVASANVRSSTPAADTASDSTTPNSGSSRRPPKPPQLLYFESELTRLMKTVPGIRDEEVREIVEYLSSEDTWSDSYDSSDYAGSDLEGSGVGRSALRRQISESCREIIDEFDRGVDAAGIEPGNAQDAGLERDAACAYRKLVASIGRVAGDTNSPRGSPPLVAKVMRHIGGRLVALMHEVSSGESAVASPRPRPPRRVRPASATTTEDDDSASDAGAAALPRSKSHDVLEAARNRGEEREASDCDRFSWRGSFESALLAADSRGTLSGEAATAARRSAGDLLAAQRTQSRSCGAIGGSEDRLWRGRRRSSAPDAGEADEAEAARAGSLPRLPSGAAPVKSARYRAPGFSRAVRAVSAPGLQVGLGSRPRRRPAPQAPHQAAAASPASAPSLRDDAFMSEILAPATSATLPRRSNSPLRPHDKEDPYRLGLHKSCGLLQQGRSESMASVYSGAGEGARGAVTVRGEAQFSLIYNYKLCALEVKVKRCRDLAPVDVKRNRSDPYVKVYLLPDKTKCGKRKTKVKKNTLNPIFEESLKFAQPLDALSARTLWLSVWSADMFGRNDFLGEVTLPLADMLFDDTAPKWYPLQERTEQFDEQQGSKGDMIVGLKFELPESANNSRAKGTLHVLVKEAKNLVATKPVGLADVFCKSYLLPERGRLAKQKTCVVRRSLNPRWEHAFTYRGLALHELAQRALELSVWDRDRISSNDFMGAVRFSLGTGSYMGEGVNWMDSVGKEVTLWQTMMQRPNFWVEGSVPLRSHLSN